MRIGRLALAVLLAVQPTNGYVPLDRDSAPIQAPLSKQLPTPPSIDNPEPPQQGLVPAANATSGPSPTPKPTPKATTKPPATEAKPTPVPTPRPTPVPTKPPPPPPPLPPPPIIGLYNAYAVGWCTWGAAYEAHAYWGFYPPTNWGNANTWAYSATYSHWHVTSTPTAHTIAWFPPGVQLAGSLGHVAWVTSVNASAGTFIVYEMDGPSGWGKWDYRVVHFDSRERFIYP